MSEHKLKAKREPTEAEIQIEAAKIARGRAENADPGFFLGAAIWILSRFPFTRHRYQNWSPTKRIIIGWLLWLILLPIIPIVAAIIWYVNDPVGFRSSPWSRALTLLVIAWATAFGFIAMNPAQLDANGRFSPVQTLPNGEVEGKANNTNTASPAAKEAVKKQTVSKASNGRHFKNCTEAFSAGVFDIKRSDKSYQSKLDRDSDGIACEK